MCVYLAPGIGCYAVRLYITHIAVCVYSGEHRTVTGMLCPDNGQRCDDVPVL